MFSGGVRWHSSCVLFHYVVMVLGVSGGLVAFILSHVVIVLVVSGALWPPHWYYLTTPKHDYHDSRVLGWISGSILGHLGCHGPPNGTNFRSQVLGELACSGHLEAGWHSSFSLVASQRMNANGRRVLGCYSSFGLMRHILGDFIKFLTE